MLRHWVCFNFASRANGFAPNAKVGAEFAVAGWKLVLNFGQLTVLSVVLRADWGVRAMQQNPLLLALGVPAASMRLIRGMFAQILQPW